jgi:hypothetical protein
MSSDDEASGGEALTPDEDSLEGEALVGESPVAGEEPVTGEEALDGEAPDTDEEASVTGGTPGGPIGVKWQVWVPVMLGLASAFLSKLTFAKVVMPIVGLSGEWWVSNGILLFSGDIYTFSLFVISFKLYDDWNSRMKFLIATGLTVSLCLLGVVFLSVICWGFIIFGWLIVTVVWGQYRLSPLRTGIWLGFGGSVSIVLGNLLAHVVL